MKKKKMKVLQGIIEIAGQGIYSVKGLKQLGIKANMVVFSPHNFNYPTDFVLNIKRNNKILYPYYILKYLTFFVYVVVFYNVYHFHFGISLLPFNLDLKLLRLLNKKIFLEFHGSDIRWVFSRNPYGEMDMPKIDHKKQKKMERILKYADGIILHDEELIEHLPNISCPVYFVPLRADVAAFEPVYPEGSKKRPLIVHAPSKRKVKGTEYILKALKEIEEEFEFILVENKSQQEAFKIYQQADIIIDQIIIGTYGVFAIEAMALGKPTITYISEEMKQTFPDELPIINASVNDIKEKVLYLIRNPEIRKQIGEESRKYVEKYHDYRKNAIMLRKVYEGKVQEVSSREVFLQLTDLGR